MKSNYELRDVVAGMRFPEGNRWRDGKLWFTDMHTGEVFVLASESAEPQLLATLDGQSSGLGWVKNGDFIVSSMMDKTLRIVGEDGSLAVFADLSGVSPSIINDLMVDEKTGRIYVGAFGYDLYNGAPPAPGPLYVVEKDGSGARLAADGFEFPNSAIIIPGTRTLVLGETWGFVLTAFDIEPDGSLTNRRIWAKLPEGVTPDGICVDLEGGIWVSSLDTGEFLRVIEGGEVTDHIPVPGRHAVDCVLGGPDGRTLYLSTADSYTPSVTIDTRQGWIQAVEVRVPGEI